MYINFMPITIILFPVAMTLREINDVRRMGFRMYRKIGCSITDILQLVFYWMYICMNIVAIVKVT